MWLASLPMSRPLAVVFWLSLALNAFLVGALVTHWFAPLQPVREVVDRPVARLIAKLSPADARIVRDAEQSLRPQLTRARAEYERALATASSIVAREPMDASAFMQAIDEVRRSRQAITDVRVKLYAQAIPRLSVQGRQLITAVD
jgi:uncharacterized membrane protein